MSPSAPQDALDLVVLTAAERLSPLGFRRRGLVLRRIRDGMCGLIQFQRSVSNTREHLRFTVNVAVVCGALLPDPGKLSKVTTPDAHVWTRLGHLATGAEDKWWEIVPTTDATALSRELAALLSDAALPFLDRYMSPFALLELWGSGGAIGITETERENLLRRLRAVLDDPHPPTA